MSDTQVRWKTHIIRLFGRRFMSKYTAGTLVYLEDAVGNVALVEPRRAPGQWTFPGGYHRRPFEDPENAGVRELREELCLDVDVPLHYVDVYRQHGRRHYDHLFVAKLDGIKPSIRRRTRFWTIVELKSVDWKDIKDPRYWPDLVEEARTALHAFSRHLGLGLDDV